MSEKEFYYFIVNPKSKTGRGRLLWQQLKNNLCKQNIPYKVYFTKGPGCAQKYTRYLTKNVRQPVRLIVLGGDGTLNEVLNGIQHFEAVTLGYIPTGSSNDFARAHHFSKDICQNFRHILSAGRPALLDFGELTAADGQSKRFIVSCGIGYDADVTREALKSPIKTFLNKVHLGKLTYFFIALKQLVQIQPGTIRISADGAPERVFKKAYFMSIHNHKFEGGGFAFTPKAVPDDGYLDICLVHGLHKLTVLLMLPSAFFGAHVRLPGVEIMRCKNVRIKTDRPLYVHADGEWGGWHSELSVSCLPGLLQIIL